MTHPRSPLATKESLYTCVRYTWLIPDNPQQLKSLAHIWTHDSVILNNFFILMWTHSSPKRWTKFSFLSIFYFSVFEMNNFTNSPINLNRLHAHTHNDSLSRDKGKTRNKGKAYNSSDWLRSTDVYTIVHNATHTHTCTNKIYSQKKKILLHRINKSFIFDWFTNQCF